MDKEKQIEEMAKDMCACCREALTNNKCELDGCACVLKHAEALYNAGYRKTSDVARKIDDLKRYTIFNEDIALKCKEENGEQNEEYFKGELSAFKRIRAYIDAELEKKYTEDGK